MHWTTLTVVHGAERNILTSEWLHSLGSGRKQDKLWPAVMILFSACMCQIDSWCLLHTWHGHSIDVHFLNKINQSYYVSNFSGSYILSFPPGRKGRVSRNHACFLASVSFRPWWGGWYSHTGPLRPPSSLDSFCWCQKGIALDNRMWNFNLVTQNIIDIIVCECEI